MQHGRIYTETLVQACMVQPGKEGKRKQSKNTDKIRKRTEIVQTTKKLIRLHPLWYLTRAAVNRHPPPFFSTAATPPNGQHMATMGAAHNQYTIQRAAAMRVTRHAHGSNDSEGTQPTVQMASFAPLAESGTAAGPTLPS